MDNLILYLVIIFTIMLFSFYIVTKAEKETFKSHYKIFQNRQIEIMGDLENIKYDKYDQVKEFIPDIYNYDIAKDSGIIRSVDNPIAFSKDEYINLGQKIKIKEEQLKKRFSEKSEDKNEKVKSKILDNLELETSYPLIRKELDILQIDKILTSMLEKFRYQPTQDINLNNEEIQKYLYSYKLVKKWIISEITKESLKDEYSIKYVNNYGYKYINDSILSYKVDYRNNIEEYQFIMTIYRENKEHNFIIYFDIIFDSYKVKYYIKNVVLLGVNYQDTIKFNTYAKNIRDPIMDSLKDNITDDYLKNLDKNIEEYLNKKEYDRNQYKKEKSYLCFFKEGEDKNTCVSPSKDQGVGIWDNPCKYNEDCPFYKKNNNYPNNRGGCHNGYCEMPLNIKLFGYKEYNSNDQAICYNCDKDKKPGCKGVECNMCCDDQKNKKLYPYLNGPDYAFENDFQDRINKKDVFLENNISPIKIIV